MTEPCRLCGELAKVVEDWEGVWQAVDGCRCAGFDVSQYAWRRLHALPAARREALSQEAQRCHAAGGRLRLSRVLQPICRSGDPVRRIRAT